MARVMIECPTTFQMVYTGIAVDSWEAFESGWFEPKLTQCPNCRAHHRWSRRDVQLEEAGGEA